MQSLQSLFSILLGIREVLLCRWPTSLRSDPQGISQQRQCPYVIGVCLEHALGGFKRFGLVRCLLISAHEQFQRIGLDHAIGILHQERFQAADFGIGVLLLHCPHVRVVFRRIFDDWGGCSRLGCCCLCWWCRSGLRGRNRNHSQCKHNRD